MSTRQLTIPHVRKLLDDAPDRQFSSKDVRIELGRHNVKRTQEQITMALCNLTDFREIKRVSRGVYQALKAPTPKPKPALRPSAAQLPGDKIVAPVSKHPAVVGEFKDSSVLIRIDGKFYRGEEL